MSLAKLKKQQANLLELLEKAENLDKPKGGSQRQDDTRYWKPQADKEGNGTFVVRFLPPIDGEDEPFVHFWAYRFKWPATNKFYYAKSLTTIGKPDPVVEMKKAMRADGREEEAKKMGRTDKYVSNILVIEDSANPENNGKVFLYEYGKQIFTKVTSAIKGDEKAKRKPFSPFDLWKSKDFIIQLKQKSGFPNYDDSTFADEFSAVAESDDEIGVIYDQVHSLKAEVSEDKYEEYDVLHARLENALGITGGSSAPKPAANKPKPAKKPAEDGSDDVPFDMDDGNDAVDNMDIDDLLKGV